MKVNESRNRVNVNVGLNMNVGAERGYRGDMIVLRSTIRAESGGQCDGPWRPRPCWFRRARRGVLFAALLEVLLATFAASSLRRVCFFLRDFLHVVLVHDARYVGAGLAKWRNALILLDALGTGIIGGQSFDQIEIVALQNSRR